MFVSFFQVLCSTAELSTQLHGGLLLLLLLLNSSALCPHNSTAPSNISPLHFKHRGREKQKGEGEQGGEGKTPQHSSTIHEASPDDKKGAHKVVLPHGVYALPAELFPSPIIALTISVLA